LQNACREFCSGPLFGERTEEGRASVVPLPWRADHDPTVVLGTSPYRPVRASYTVRPQSLWIGQAASVRGQTDQIKGDAVSLSSINEFKLHVVSSAGLRLCYSLCLPAFAGRNGHAGPQLFLILRNSD